MATENIQKESVLEKRLNTPLMRLRISLFDSISKKEFSREDLDKFIASIVSETPEDKTKAEAIKAHSVIEMGRIAGSSMAKPEVNTPAQQLIWAANIAYLHLNPSAQDGWDKEYRGETVAKTPLWKQLLGSERVKMEKLRYALHLSSCVKNPEAKLRWGEPGSWFYNDPKANMVNLDLMQSMLLGFEHSRSVALHEVGHAELTVDFTPKMHEVRNKLTALQEVTKKRKLTKEEYKEYSLLGVEWKLRFQIFNAAEDNCVNRYAKVIGDKQYQDHGPSLNHMETILHRVGLKEEESTLGKIKGLAFKPDEDSPEAKFQALSTAVNLSFFKENGMFEGTDEDWKKLGVNPSKISELGEKTGQNFDDLINACDSMPGKESNILEKLSLKKKEPASIAWLQPELAMTRRERAKGIHFYNKKVLELNAKRNEIIDRIFEDFAKDTVAEILKKYEKQIDEQLNDNQQGQQGESDNSSREQEGQEGEAGASGSAQGQSSMPVEGMEEEQPDEGNVPETPEEARQEEREENQGEQSSDDQNSSGGGGGEGSDSEDGKDSEGEDGGEGSDSEDEKDSEGEGGGEGSDSEDEKDSENGKGSGDENEKGSVEKEDKEKTIEELVEEYKEKEGQEKEAEEGKKKTMQRRLEAAKNSSNEDGNSSGGSGAGGGTKNLPLGDWSDYQAMAKQFKPASNRLSRIFEKVREHQLRTVKSISRSKTLIPEDGEFSRFSSSAQMALNKKKTTGRQLEEKDFRLFNEDKDKTKTSKVDLVVWIDGSGSMSGDPLKRAIQAGCLLLEATKEDKSVNTYVGIWGHDSPILLASPGDTPKEIGERIQGAQNGLGSSTNMAPAVKKTAEIIATRKTNANEPIGYTHMLFISDGDIFDGSETKEAIKTLFKNTKDITLDVAITSNGYRSGTDETEMQRVIENTAKEVSGSSVGVSHGHNPDDLLNSFMDSLLKRIRANKSMVAKPAASKQKAMKKALDEMNKGR